MDRMRLPPFLDCSTNLFSVVAVAALIFTCHTTRAQMVSPPPASADASRRTEAVTLKPAVTSSVKSDLSFTSDIEDNFGTYAPSSPGDSDIGEQLILRQREKQEDWNVQADAFAFWTNNAAHVSSGAQSDAFWGGRASVNWHPRITSRLIADVSVSQDVFRYNEFDFLDFESFNVSAGLIWIEPRLRNTAFLLQYGFNRLTQDFDDLMQSHSIRFGVQKLFIINRRNSIATSILADWDIDNDVSQLKRNEYIGDVAWRFLLTRKVELSLNYRYTWFDYADVDRTDSFHSVGFNVTYSPWTWLQLYAGASYSFNDSSFDPYDYEAANLGGGIGARLKF